MDPSDLTSVVVKSVKTNIPVVVPVTLERSWAVCPAAGRPFDLVYGKAMELYTDDGIPPLTVTEYQGDEKTTIPVWVAMYHVESSYLRDVGRRHICVVYDAEPDESGDRITEYYNSHVEDENR